MRISAEDYRAMQQEKPAKNKFMAKAKVYNGEKYHSTKEADQAALYDIARNAKNPAERVVKVERQLPFDLVVNGVHICKYILDFRVTYADGRVDHTDVKGVKEGVVYQMFRLKKYLMLALFSIEVKEL